MIIPLLLALALVLAAAKAGGWASRRLGQPAVLGELLAGVLLGPSVLNLFGLHYFESAHVHGSLEMLSELGVIFLMFAAGLEINITDMLKTGKPAVFSGVLGVFVPIGLGAGAALLFGYNIIQSVFLGLVLAATSVSISAQTLMEMGLLRSREGLTLLGAAVVDDVLAIADLSVFVGIVLGGGAGALPIIWNVVRMLLFLVGAFFLGSWLLPRAVRLARRVRVSEPVMASVIISMLIFAWASEELGGVAAITGAFIAGVALSRSSERETIERGIHTLAYSLFVPLFLVGIGLTANLRDLSSNDIGLAVAISGVAIISKLIGSGAGARLGGLTWRESLRVGVGMVSRGEVGLIIASVGVHEGIIDNDIFTIAVVMVVITTLAAPPLLRLVFHEKEATHG